MNDSFECVWEELRPVPRVRIDFRNGHVLDRTLSGSVATLFCDADGLVYDLLPGIVNEQTYREALNLAVLRHRSSRGDMDAIVKLAKWSTDGLLSTLPDSPFIQDFNVEVAKGASIEVPLKVAIGIDPNIKLPDEDLESDEVDLDFYYAPSTSEVALELDSIRVRTKLLPKALALLESMPNCTPEVLTSPLFREVLHVDLDDPFLGLAPNVLGGELGRYGPSGVEGMLPQGVQ